MAAATGASVPVALLNDPFLRKQRVKLLKMWGTNGQRISSCVAGLRTQNNPTSVSHPADAVSDEETPIVTIGFTNAISKQVEEALSKIDEGTYYECKDCKGKIPRARLKFVPQAVRCVECEQKREAESRA